MLTTTRTRFVSSKYHDVVWLEWFCRTQYMVRFDLDPGIDHMKANWQSLEIKTNLNYCICLNTIQTLCHQYSPNFILILMILIYIWILDKWKENLQNSTNQEDLWLIYAFIQIGAFGNFFRFSVAFVWPCRDQAVSRFTETD